MKMPPFPKLLNAEGSASVVVGHQQIGALVGEVVEEVDAWTRVQVEMFLLAYGQAVREECARHCEQIGDGWFSEKKLDLSAPQVCEMIAKSIRGPSASEAAMGIGAVWPL